MNINNRDFEIEVLNKIIWFHYYSSGDTYYTLSSYIKGRVVECCVKDKTIGRFENDRRVYEINL